MKKTSMILNSAAETISCNQDLLTEILLRLPTKSLIKFKCVSRQWFSIISDPEFCFSHTRHHQSNGFLSPTAFLLKENECLQKMRMALPTTMDAPEECRYFGESRGVLYLAVTYCMAACLEFDVFEMARDYSQWNWKKRLNLGDAVKVFPELELGCVEYNPGFSGVCFIRSEKEEEPKVVVWADGKIICFDFREGTWNKLHDLGPGIKIGSLYLGEYDHLHYERFHAYQYFENLSCL